MKNAKCEMKNEDHPLVSLTWEEVMKIGVSRFCIGPFAF
jgi:hypothetical protein